MALISIILTTNNKQIEQIVQLGDRIWREHYEPIIGIDQVNYMLDKFQSVPSIQKQISEGAEYYLISASQTPVGYLAVQKKDDALFLSKLYVLSSERSKGIGKKAIDFIKNRAIDLTCSKLSLTVNKYNFNSIAAYKKMGFVIKKELVMDIGKGYVMDDYYMEMDL